MLKPDKLRTVPLTLQERKCPFGAYYNIQMITTSFFYNIAYRLMRSMIFFLIIEHSLQLFPLLESWLKSRSIVAHRKVCWPARISARICEFAGVASPLPENHATAFVFESREKKVPRFLTRAGKGRRGFPANGTKRRSPSLSRLRCLRETGGGVSEEGLVEL